MTMTTGFRTLALLLAAAGLVGCDLAMWLAKLAPDPKMTREAIATRAAPEELVFQGQLAGEPTFLLVYDCEVYRVDQQDNGGVQWTRVLAREPYPSWTSCQRQSMSFEAGTLTVTLGRKVPGAEACCATGGTYHSVDGRAWKKVS